MRLAYRVALKTTENGEQTMKGLRYILLVLLAPLFASGCSTTSGGGIGPLNHCGVVGTGVGGVAGALIAEEALAGIIPGVVVGAAVGHMLCWTGDSDGDGVKNSKDQCPDTPKGVNVNENGCPDTDGDGVVDGVDDCPNTPEGIPVKSNGCPPDTDGDGVADYEDACMHTPPGILVKEDGCAQCGQLLGNVENVNFDFGKSEIRSDSTGVLAKVVDAVKSTSTIVRIEGYTDSIGSDAYNLKLSKERAKAVAEYLISQGISTDNISSVTGNGKSIPPAKTKEGRSANRRVEIIADCGS